MSEKHIKFQVDYSKLKVVNEYNTKNQRYPLVLSVPHSGTVFPEEFLENTKLEMYNASPNDGKYCSRSCQSKDIQRELTKFVNNKEILKFIESKKKIINHTVNFMLTTSFKDENLSPEDMQQEARISLFYLYIRSLRKNMGK